MHRHRFAQTYGNKKLSDIQAVIGEIENSDDKKKISSLLTSRMTSLFNNAYREDSRASYEAILGGSFTGKNTLNDVFDKIKNLLKIESVTGVRILNRYDVENITEEIFEQSKRTVFSEPQLDNIYDALPETDGVVFAVEYLPGQFDQRADSAAQCIQIISQGERPLIRTAKVYALYGDLTAEEIEKIKKQVSKLVNENTKNTLPILITDNENKVCHLLFNTHHVLPPEPPSCFFNR